MLHVVGLFALLTLLIHLASIGLVWRRCRPRPAPRAGAGMPAVSIIRPVCGVDHHEVETLRSGFMLDHPRYELIFCVAKADDPVIPLVRRLMAEHQDVPARLLIGDERVSANPKLNNLVKGWPQARAEWIVLADSNVLMPPDYLARLFAAWQPGTGLVCSPPIGIWPKGFWAEIECAFLNEHQARWQYAADTLGLGFAQGKTMFWRRADLDAVGGIEALAAEIAEDAAATKVVRGQGRRVRLVDGPFAQPLGQRDAASVWRRQLRWARLRRATFKRFFIPEILTGALWPLAATLAYAIGMDWPLPAVLAAFLLTWYGAEGALARHAGWPLSWRSPLAWMLRDLMLPLLWIEAWRGSDFSWRGNDMTTRQATAMGGD